VRFSTQAIDFSHLHTFQAGSEAHPASYHMRGGGALSLRYPCGRRMKLTPHLHLESRLRIIYLHSATRLHGVELNLARRQRAFLLASAIFKNINKTNSVALVRVRTIPTERPPLVGEVSANFCGWRVLRGQHNGSLRFSRSQPLLFLSSSSSIVLTRLGGRRSRPTTSQKIW
jgi:hypothetical protein